MKKELQSITSSSIKNGFRSTGLYPLNPDSPDYPKCLEIEETQQNQARHTPPVIPPSAIDQKEDYKCALGVIEIELETLKKYQGRLSEHAFSVYTTALNQNQKIIIFKYDSTVELYLDYH